MEKRERVYKQLAQVALNIPTENLFTYLIPPALEGRIQQGHLVSVPVKKREVIGLVMEVSDIPDESSQSIDNQALKEKGDLTQLSSLTDALCQSIAVKDCKEVNALPYLGPVLDPPLIELAKWMSEYYLCPIGITIRALIPAGLIPEQVDTKEGGMAFSPKGREKFVAFLRIMKNEEEVRDFLQVNRKRSPRQCILLEALLEKGGSAFLPDISHESKNASSLVKGLIKKGMIEQTRERVFRNPLKDNQRANSYGEITLTHDQKKALDALSNALDEGGFSPFLLHGITGSGKTEIYLRLVLKAMKKGLQSIILVPEISITHQLIERFRYYMGDRIAILHSHLSEGERLDEWQRIKQGLAEVVIGARSAIFAPVARLGVVICDEEHDASYKQQESPRYQGRDVAIMRAKMANCLICLGSATPSLESYYNAKMGKYHLLSLPERVTPHSLPSVFLIDMKEEFDSKRDKDMPQPMFAQKLQKAIEETITKGEQTLIFQNRRGHSLFLLCPKCGHVPKCPHCSVSLTYHSTENMLKCHYCEYQRFPILLCPHCPQVPMNFVGHGTQKIEQELRGLFSSFSVARMDRDSTSRKGAHYKILSRLERGETDILVGTQMVTKGLDIPTITLVGVIGVDHILNLPDFRATERVFQMITQVAGRAGRGDEPGKVLVQTYSPDHYSLLFACDHDYLSFYEREIGFRRQLSYPPFARLVSIIIRGKDRKVTRKAAIFLGKQIKQEQAGASDIRCLGPAMAPLFRLKGSYRYQILIKAKNYKSAHSLITVALTTFSQQKEFSKIKVEVDVDPVNLL